MKVTGTDIPVGETDTCNLIKLNVKSDMLKASLNVLTETCGDYFSSGSSKFPGFQRH